jgi:hypothetical protein
MDTETSTEDMEETNEFTGEATYCPEDNKLRLYVGWVERSEYEKLRSEGWVATPKQDCDFVATWTPDREDTAIEYAGVIGDEDVSPQDRAVDRAERFAGYRDKRLGEAVGHADRYDAGPAAHGYQSEKRAERAAMRHDRMAARSLSSWDKADYWVGRTNGVINNALYKSSPGVRMGRIKEIEKELRQAQKAVDKYREDYKRTQEYLEAPDECFEYLKSKFDYKGWSDRDIIASILQTIGSYGKYTHPRLPDVTGTLYSLAGREDDPITLKEGLELYLARRIDPDSEGYASVGAMRWINHCNLRLGYENQMLEAQGGRAAMIEMEVGGKIGGYTIRKVNKSAATGRVVSVTVKAKGDRWGNTSEGFHMAVINIERLPIESYTAPTDEDKAALKAEIAAEKKAKPKVKPIPFINPTMEDAIRLQDIWNEHRNKHWDRDPKKVLSCPQKWYSANSKGSYSRCETVLLTGGGLESREGSGFMRRPDCPVVVKVRSHDGAVVVINDKPQKPLPGELWIDPRVEMREDVERRILELRSIMTPSYLSDEIWNHELVRKGRIVGLAYIDSMSQFGLTSEGNKIALERAGVKTGLKAEVAG